MSKLRTKSYDRSTVIDCRKMVCDREKASLIGHHDRQYSHVTTTFTNFIFFTTFSKAIFAIFFKKQTKTTTGTLRRQLGIWRWSVIT